MLGRMARRAPALVPLRLRVRRALPFAARTYRWFHQHPELSGAERETAARLAEELAALGLAVTCGIGGHGVVGILEGGRPGPVVLVRADMDALPVTEATGLPFASRHAGVMHACGHDLHMACSLGALRALVDARATLPGTVLFVGQPAEETGSGASAMLADRRFRTIVRRIGRPRIAFALHGAADLPTGSVGMTRGFANANVDTVDIVVHGKSGHAARPHLCCDPVVIGAEIVLSLQSVVSRRTETGEPAVITVGAFLAGTKHNVIPERATLLVTVRSYAAATRRHLLDEIARVARHIAIAHGARRPPDVVLRSDRSSAAYNDPAWTDRLVDLFGDALGSRRVVIKPPSLGGEDFGEFSRQLRIPGVMWKLGTTAATVLRRRAPGEVPGLHSDRFVPALRGSLETGILSLVVAVEDALGPGKPLRSGAAE
jgi:amidohydrolase